MANSTYNPKRTRNVYDPKDPKPFKLSRSKIDLFMQCQRCFYLDRRLGIGQPPSFPFNLNSAVDALLKKEFDEHRLKKTPHPLMSQFGVDAIPFAHEKMDEWRDALRRGVTYFDEKTNLILSGGIDDVWVNKAGELHVVDYKATAKEGEVSLDYEWQDGYRRQVEVYQWLFRKNGFKVSNTAYFVYCNGDLGAPSFNSRLEFKIKVIPYVGKDTWISNTVSQIWSCLQSDGIPPASERCPYCLYRQAAREVE